MRYLLTSAGIKNARIHTALLELLGRPIAECNALCIPTASYAISGGTESAYRIITGTAFTPMCELGWKSLGVLELTALPSVDRDIWVPKVQATDILLVGGGEPFYLSYWVRHSGLLDILPSLRRDMVWMGISAGSMVAAPDMGEVYDGTNPEVAKERGLGLVDFAVHAHLDHERIPQHSMANCTKLAESMSVPSYLIDDETAVQVVDGAVNVISEGNWKLVTP